LIVSPRIEPNESGSIRLPIATEIATTHNEVADPGLAAVVAAWPDLPDAIRAGIVAMVKAADSRIDA
jgi:hypothetical protein